MSDTGHDRHSHPLLVRLWLDDVEGGEQTGQAAPQWQGKVQHLISGKSHCFYNLQALLDLLPQMLLAPEAPHVSQRCSGTEAESEEEMSLET